jgi:HPt (histidine-containing phosphotransfer) domain-containing protein
MLGDRAFIARLLTQFRESEAGLAQEIQRALDMGDAAEARRLAHRLKGVAGNLRAAAIFEAACGIEALIDGPRAPDASAVKGPLDALRRALAQLSAEIDAARAAPTPAVSAASAAPLDARALSDRLAPLCALLEACDLAADDLWAELSDDVGCRDAGVRERVDSAVEALRYDEARALLREFAARLAG